MHNGRNGIDTQGGKRGIGHAWLCHAQPGIEGTVFGLCPGQWHHLSHSSGCGAFFEGIRGKALSGTAAMNGKVLERYAELMIDKIRQMSAGE